MSEDMHQCAIPAANITTHANTPIASRLFLRFPANDIGGWSRDADSGCLLFCNSQFVKNIVDVRHANGNAVAAPAL